MFVCVLLCIVRKQSITAWTEGPHLQIERSDTSISELVILEIFTLSSDMDVPRLSVQSVENLAEIYSISHFFTCYIEC